MGFSSVSCWLEPAGIFDCYHRNVAVFSNLLDGYVLDMIVGDVSADHLFKENLCCFSVFLFRD